jgi:hypothetical protein
MKNKDYELRIEVKERYISNEDELEHLEECGIEDVEKYITYKYRRTNLRFDDIERLIEIKGNKKECILKFYGDYEIVILANYDDLCIEFNDIRNGNYELNIWEKES